MATIPPNATNNDLKKLLKENISKIELTRKPLSDLLEKIDNIILSKRRNLELRLFSYSDNWEISESLSKMNHLTNLTIDWAHIENIEFLNAIKLNRFYLQVISGNPSLRPLQEHKELKELTIKGEVKDLDSITELDTIERLTLKNMKIKNLKKLISNLELTELKIGSCGKIDLSPIAMKSKSLKKLEIGPFRRIEDINFVSSLYNLEKLSLYSLAKITSLPKLENLKKLREIEIRALNKVKDLKEIITLTCLKEFRCITCSGLSKYDFNKITNVQNVYVNHKY